MFSDQFYQRVSINGILSKQFKCAIRLMKVYSVRGKNSTLKSENKSI